MTVPEWLHDLNCFQRLKVEMGNSLAAVACTLAKAQRAAGGIFVLKQPASSLMMALEVFLGDYEVDLGSGSCARAVC